MKRVGTYNGIPVYEDENVPPAQLFFIHQGAFEPFTELRLTTNWQRFRFSAKRQGYRGSHVIIGFCQATTVRGLKMVPEITAIYQKVRLLCHKAVKWMR